MKKTAIVNSQKYLSVFRKKILPVFLVSMAMILLCLGPGRPAMAQDTGDTVHVQGDQGSASPATPVSQQQGQVAGQAQQQPHQAADLQEDEITYFDPSTIPDTVPIPDADWVFEVPINVSDIQPEVTQLGIVCEVFRFVSPPYQDPHKIHYGKAKKSLI